MHVERDPIGCLKNPRSLKNNPSPSLLFAVTCSLFSEPRGFGAWLEPRYIFGAGRLD